MVKIDTGKLNQWEWFVCQLGGGGERRIVRMKSWKRRRQMWGKEKNSRHQYAAPTPAPKRTWTEDEAIIYSKTSSLQVKYV